MDQVAAKRRPIGLAQRGERMRRRPVVLPEEFHHVGRTERIVEAVVDAGQSYQRELPQGQTGWLAGARDPGVGKALTLIHHQHEHPWTVPELAHEVGVSRTVLSERFRHFLGEPPMANLTRWRLQLGARALTSTTQSVAQVASDVGYESEAAFNRAFKRKYGLPPARYRRDKTGVLADGRENAQH